MSENLPPLPNAGQKPPPRVKPPKKPNETREFLVGCGIALLIGIGLLALICISACFPHIH